MSRLGFIGIILFGLTLIAGCNLVQPLEVSSVEGLENIAIGRGGLEGEFTVVFSNPNPFPIQAKGVEVEGFVNGKKVGLVSLPEAQAIAKGQGELQLEFDTEKGALLQIIEANLMNFLLGQDVKLAVKGNVKGSAFGIELTVPVEAEQNLKIQL